MTVMLFRLPRAVCAAVLAFTSELVPARELPLHDFEIAGLEPSHADFDDEPVCGADGGPEYWVSPSHNCYCQKPRGHEEGTDHECWCLAIWPNLPDAAAVPPAAACCSDGGVTPTVPPSEPPTRTAEDDAVWIYTWLEQILHVHFGDLDEDKTVNRWLADPGSFDIFGQPFCRDIQHSPAYFDTNRNK